MSRLPIQGGDDGTWGGILNDYLSQEHNADGSHTGKVSHAQLSGISADQHHAQSHVHNGSDGSGTVAHAATTGITPNDHHAQAHTVTGTDHTASGLTSGHVLRATGAAAFSFGQAQHTDLGSVSSDQHHNKSHLHDGADGSGTVAHSATTGITANDHHSQSHGASDHSGAIGTHSQLTSVGANDHHNQAHSVTGADHTASGLTTGHFLRASGATAFAFAQGQHADLGGVSADQHHAQSHVHDGADGSGTVELVDLSDVNVTGITDGQLIQWNSSTSRFIPVSPTGNAEIAYAENVTGTTTTVAGTTGAAGTAVDIPSCSISVPATSRPVWIEAKICANQSVAGLGRVAIVIVETTSGSVTLEQALAFLPNSTSARGTDVGVPPVRVRLGSTSGTRTFKLQARCDSVAANTPSFLVTNGTNTRSYIRAWAE